MENKGCPWTKLFPRTFQKHHPKSPKLLHIEIFLDILTMWLLNRDPEEDNEL